MKQLQVVIPFHQPLSSSDDDMEAAVREVYEPILDRIEKDERVRVALHFSGHLLDFLARRRDSFLLRTKSLVRDDRIEVLGGLFHGGIPALLPEIDIRGQIQMMGEFWESFAGVSPSGFWLPEFAWCRELPRLFDETGLEYGFVSSSQVQAEDRDRVLGTTERGGRSLAAFIIDDAASDSLPDVDVGAWHNSLDDDTLQTVWVRAESMGLEPGTRDHCLEGGWLDRWLSSLAECEMILPSEAYDAYRPTYPIQIQTGWADSVQICSENPPRGWGDWPRSVSEVEAIHRTMLRVSDRLREAIAVMEEDEKEEEWSDTLATAQRLVFSAQSPDVYWRGLQAGYSDPELRDSVVERILRADDLIDSLLQGEEDWLATEEEDRDGDLVEEVFVSNRHLGAAIVPAKGGQIRLLLHRASHRNALDVGERRREPFADDAKRAPTNRSERAPRRGSDLVRASDSLPLDEDGQSRTGIREWILPVDAEANSFFAGRQKNLLSDWPSVDVRFNEVEEQGDVAYRLELTSEQSDVSFDKVIKIPIDRAQVKIDYRAKGNNLLFGTEIPVRLGRDTKAFVNGQEVADRSLSSITQLELKGSDARLTLGFEPAMDVWCEPIRTTVRDLEGYRAVEQGMVVVPVTPLSDDKQFSITVEMDAKSS